MPLGSHLAAMKGNIDSPSCPPHLRGPLRIHVHDVMRSLDISHLSFCRQQILRVAEIEKTADIRRPNIKQLLVPNLRFPLPHRVVKSRSTFSASRPSTFY